MDGDEAEVVEVGAAVQAVQVRAVADSMAAVGDFAVVPAWGCGGKNRPVGEYSGYTWLTSRKAGNCFRRMWWLPLPALRPAWLFPVCGYGLH